MELDFMLLRNNFIHLLAIAEAIAICVSESGISAMAGQFIIVGEPIAIGIHSKDRS